MIEKAIILVAGTGSRLKPLTNDIPKCLTEVNSIPILINALKLLEKNKIKETVLVIGYLGDKIKERIGSKFNNMKVSYIENPIYQKTNSMYSLWLARDYLKQGVILLEGDVFFEEDIMKKIVTSDQSKSHWVVDKFTQEFDGSMSTTDNNDRIVKTQIVREKLPEYKDNYFKSCGILQITREFGKIFSQWLDQDVEKGNVNIYYDLVLSQHLAEYPIYILSIHGLKWFEIDNLEDLKKAEAMFKTQIIIKKEKVIGILGGMGPYATADIFKKIIELTPAKKDWEHLRIIIDNNPKIPSRTRAIVLNDADPSPMMVETAQNLEKAGADFIIIPCNSAHYFYDKVKAGVKIPILHIIEETAKQIKKELPSIKKVGLLAGLVPIKANLYGKTFAKFNIEVIHPNDNEQDMVVDAIEAIKLGKTEKEIKEKMLHVSNELVNKGAEAIILGCTELSIIFKNDKFKVPLFDSDIILAQAAVNKAKNNEN